jgi:hypothetical protein
MPKNCWRKFRCVSPQGLSHQANHVDPFRSIRGLKLEWFANIRGTSPDVCAAALPNTQLLPNFLRNGDLPFARYRRDSHAFLQAFPRNTITQGGRPQQKIFSGDACARGYLV